jgi:hypothetical protein
MTNMFISKDTLLQSVPGPFASTDHVSTDEGIASLRDLKIAILV